MVFALETYCPATDGRSAARIEEEVVVTKDGNQLLTRFPAEDLLVAGKTYVRGADVLELRARARCAHDALPADPPRGDRPASRRCRSTAAVYKRAGLIGGDTGATHTGLWMVELEGHVDTHLHSFENSFYVFDGEPILYLDGRGVQAPAGRLRSHPGRRAPCLAQRRPRALDRDGLAAPARPDAAAGHVLPRRAPDERAGRARPPRSAQPPLLPPLGGRHGRRRAERRARGRRRRPSRPAWPRPRSSTAESP